MVKHIAVIAAGLIIFLTGCGSQSNCWPEISSTAPATPHYPQTPSTTYKPPRYTPPVPTITKTIIVDPGHGGHDPGAGAVGYSSVPEKTIVLDISKNLAKNLSAAGAKVVMTRTNDTFIELDDRAATAEKYNAGLLVSIHADSCPKAHIAGPTVYIARSATRQSRRVAQNVVNAFNNAGIKSRGIREADFRVLVKHSKPSILVECGYLTNRTEASRLCSTSYRKKVAQIIAQGIINSF